MRQKISMQMGGNTITRCPVCGHPVRVIMRDGRHTDHYEALSHDENWRGDNLLPQDEATAARLRELRQGKKTVALVGMAPTSCALAPYDDLDVEIWGLNEMHAFPWMKRATRWFQLHHSDSWHRPVAKRAVHNHLEWLKSNPWNIPVYMQYWNEEVPNAVAYPLREVSEMAFGNFRRGDETIKYFTSTLAYYMGIALLEGFDRIEIYGFEMAATEEYIEQKGCAEFWIGLAMGRGVEIYIPDNCILMWSSLYGGNEQGAGW